MTRLTKGLYGSEFHPSNIDLFGLRCGQMRCNDFIHNGGWYNKAGEKIGFGDLSENDFRRIAQELEEGELFIILHESDSFWNFVTKPGMIGSMSATNPDINAPGVDYVASKAAYVIVKDIVFFVNHDGPRALTTGRTPGGMLCHLIEEADLRSRMVASDQAEARL